MENTLESLVREFVDKHKIACAEAIYDSDRVTLNSGELLESLIEQVGYYVYEENE